MSKNKLIQIFDDKNNKVQKIFLENEWWYSVVDVCRVLTESPDAGSYWGKLKQRLVAEGSEVATICRQMKLTAPDGKQRETDCANMEGMFRIIQSIPSPKAEPFKLWLAKVGKERIEEINNPELGIERAKQLYEKKGYSPEWIAKRMLGIEVRHKLTDEWDERGARTPQDYALLTNEIMQGAFELKVDQHKKLKELKKENLRDHMTDLELIITMLAEATTTQVTQQNDSQGVPELKKDAKIGGAVAIRKGK